MKYKIIFCCPITNVNQIKYKEENFFYFGNRTFKEYKNVFNIDMEDKLDNLALKMLLGYQQISKLNFDFVFKYDTDTYINFDSLESLNLDINTNYGFLYEGKPFKEKKVVSKTNLSVSFPLGGGYILSKQAINFIANKKYEQLVRSHIKNGDYTFEDAVIGAILKENNLSLQNTGYWINKSQWCYSSCYDCFFHSTNTHSEEVFKKLLYLRSKIHKAYKT